MAKAKEARFYDRVSTAGQTTDNETVALREVAEHQGWGLIDAYPITASADPKGVSSAPHSTSYARVLRDFGMEAEDQCFSASVNSMKSRC